MRSAPAPYLRRPSAPPRRRRGTVPTLSLIHISTTQETYESRIRLHIIPEIGDIPLNKLTQNDLQQFYGRLKNSGRKRFTDKYGEGLSDLSLIHI